MVKKFFIGLLLVLLPLTSIAHAQESGQPFAAVDKGVLTLYGVSAQPLPVNNPPNRGFSSLVWSPDGSKLAYLLQSQDFKLQLMITDAAASAPIQLNTGEIEAGFPITFTPDGKIIYIGRGVLPGADSPVYHADVKRIAPEANAQPQTLGTFAMGIGCGGGSPLPGDWRYWEESGFGGNFLTLKMTDFGLLHSTNCLGVGLALFNLQSGVDTPVGAVAVQNGHTEGYSRAALSPDGQKLAALYTRFAQPDPARSLAIIDLKTLSETPVTTADRPDQIAWGADGTLFYSTRTFDRNLVDALTEEEKQALAETNTLDIPGNAVSIHLINPATNDAQVIYQGDAYAIGRMALSADGQSLIFSQVANQGDWIKAIADGTLDVVQDSNGDAQRALVPVTVYQLPLSGTAPVVLGADLAQFSLRPVAR